MFFIKERRVYRMIYLFLANGFEEIEALTPVDVLRRGGVEVTTVGIGGTEITGSHHITVKADMSDKEFSVLGNVEGIILPGGMPGTKNLERSSIVIKAVRYCFERNIVIGAICAAPSILGHLGILNGKKATAFPGFERDLFDAEISSEYVSVDGNIITARGMGVSVDFALALLEALKDSETANNIKNSIQCRP